MSRGEGGRSPTIPQHPSQIRGPCLFGRTASSFCAGSLALWTYCHHPSPPQSGHCCCAVRGARHADAIHKGGACLYSIAHHVCRCLEVCTSLPMSEHVHCPVICVLVGQRDAWDPMGLPHAIDRGPTLLLSGDAELSYHRLAIAGPHPMEAVGFECHNRF